MRRLVAALLLAGLVGMGTTGCVELPRPVAATEAPRPALTLVQADAVMTEIRATTTQADRKQSAKVAATVLTGHELAVATGAYTLSKQLGHRRTYDLDKMTVRAVRSGPAATYPQQAVAMAAYADPKLKKWTVLAWLTRVDAGAPWRLGMLVPVETTKLPVLAAKSAEGVSTLLEGNTTVGGTRISGASEVVGQAMNDPRSDAAKRFRTSPLKAHFDTAELGHHDHATTSVRFTTRPDFLGLPTTDGRALVLAESSAYYFYVLDDGWYVSYSRRSEVHTRFRGRYASTTDSLLVAVGVVVPAERAAKLDLVSMEFAATGFTATKFDEGG